jgi:hypothetical protein
LSHLPQADWVNGLYGPLFRDEHHSVHSPRVQRIGGSRRRSRDCHDVFSSPYRCVSRLAAKMWYSPNGPSTGVSGAWRICRLGLPPPASCMARSLSGRCRSCCGTRT